MASCPVHLPDLLALCGDLVILALPSQPWESGCSPEGCQCPLWAWRCCRCLEHTISPGWRAPWCPVSSVRTADPPPCLPVTPSSHCSGGRLWSAAEPLVAAGLPEIVGSGEGKGPSSSEGMNHPQSASSCLSVQLPGAQPRAATARTRGLPVTMAPGRCQALSVRK